MNKQEVLSRVDVCFSRELFQQARELLQEVLRKDPNNLQACNDMFYACLKLKQYEQARSYLNQALRTFPQASFLHFNLGILDRELGNYEQALEHFSTAIELDCTISTYWSEIGSLYMDLGRYDASRMVLLKAVNLDPKNYQALFNLGEVCLLEGHFKEGWKFYEARPSVAVKNSNPRYRVESRWQGEDLTGKTLLLHSEQGFGDTFQFLRYGLKFKELGARVIIEVPTSLVPLMQCQSWIDQVLSRDLNVPHYDYQIPMMSCGWWFSKVEQDIPNHIPYIQADPELVDKWSYISGETYGVCTIGAGGKGNLGDRNIPLPLLGRLLDHLGEVVNLNQRADLDRVGAFTDTAAIIANCRAIITIDTAVAHLAGAMGKPTYLMLPKNCNWRWMLERSDSPWYPTMRIIRQTVEGDWSNVIDQLVQEIL